MPPDATAIAMVDAQPKAGPALSATSDMPVAEKAPPPISEEVNKGAEPTEAEKAAAAEAAAAAPPDDGADKTGTDPEKPGEQVDDDPLNSDKTPAWLKGLATKERNKARAAEARATAAEKRADDAAAISAKALTSLETLTKAEAARITQDADQKDPRPVRETFDDPSRYEDALIEWAGRRAALVAESKALEKIEADKVTEAEAVQKKATEEATKKTLAEYAERRAKFIEAHPDFEELVETQHPDDRSKELQINIPMAQVIYNSEDGPDIAYYLGKNPDEAARISKLTPLQAVKELGRISARIASQPAPATKPAPIKALKTGSEAATRKTPAEESMEEYGARRQREIANQDRTRRGLAPLN